MAITKEIKKPIIVAVGIVRDVKSSKSFSVLRKNFSLKRLLK
jgi:hypothetical protein